MELTKEKIKKYQTVDCAGAGLDTGSHNNIVAQIACSEILFNILMDYTR